MRIGVFLVDDHEDIRLLWRLTISVANDGLTVVGEASSAAEALSSEEQADVYVVDFMMPGMTGLDLVRSLRERGVDDPVILCTAFLDDELRRQADELGVAQCLPKDQLSVLPDVIRAAVAA
jgi:DNA-binding NarL/FixJ family response regulator